MNPKRNILFALFASVLFAAGCGATSSGGSNAAAADAGAPGPDAITAENAVRVADDGVHVTIYVTSEGFIPAEVHVPSGKLVTLHVTRKIETTCATQLVMKDQNIVRDLPLDRTVAITFTPEKPGALRYACGMDMVFGTIIVD